MADAIGVVGLGNMGLGMAATLVRKGFRTIGFDVAPARVDLAVEAGAARVHGLPELFQAAPVILLSLPTAAHVEGVLTGVGGLLDSGARGRLVIDTSTVEAEATRRLAARLAAAGHALLDAPVSGGAAGAHAGTLTMMVGGADSDLARARSVLDAVAARVIHVGGSGAGNVAKLVNNLLCAAHLLTTAEGLRLARAAGVEPDRVLEVVNAASGGSAVSATHIPRWVLSGAFDSGFTMGLMRKDVRLALTMAARAGVALPLATLAGAQWAEAELDDAEDFTRIADLGDRR